MIMTETQPVTLQRIGQIAVPVKDLQRATAFYRDVLNLRLLLDVPGMAFFDIGGVRLMLSVPESPEFDHRASILYYEVPDIAAAHAQLESRGVPFLRPPHMIADMGAVELWMAFFRDPDGNVLALMCEKPKR